MEKLPAEEKQISTIHLYETECFGRPISQLGNQVSQAIVAAAFHDSHRIQLTSTCKAAYQHHPALAPLEHLIIVTLVTASNATTQLSPIPFPAIPSSSTDHDAQISRPPNPLHQRLRSPLHPRHPLRRPDRVGRPPDNGEDLPLRPRQARPPIPGFDRIDEDTQHTRLRRGERLGQRWVALSASGGWAAA